VKIVYAERQYGKTTAAVEAVVRTNGFLLVKDYNERDRILREYRKKDVNGTDTYIRPEQVITVNELDDGRFETASPTHRVIIDNLELVIEQLVGMQVDVVTTSTEPETVIGYHGRIAREALQDNKTDAEGVVEVDGATTVDEYIAGRTLGMIVEKKRCEIEASGILANDERIRL
jgi:hypothetical protein